MNHPDGHRSKMGMKTCLALIAVLALGASSAWAQVVKIGTVDMKRAFASYYKTKDAEARLNEQRNQSKSGLDERSQMAMRCAADLKKLDEELALPGLSQETRTRMQQQRGQKVDELQNAEREVREFQQSREKQLQEQSVRLRAAIVEDINKVVADKVKAGNYDIVFDKSGPSLNSMPVVVNAKDTFDFTDDVVAALNQSQATR